jgi:hypothetical protein
MTSCYRKLPATIVAIAWLAWTPASHAATLTAEQRSNFIDNWVAALSFERKCSHFHLNRRDAAVALSTFGDKPFDPEGSDHAEMDARTHFYIEKLHSLDGPSVCKLAETMFGPNGAAIRNFMLPN